MSYWPSLARDTVLIVSPATDISIIDEDEEDLRKAINPSTESARIIIKSIKSAFLKYFDMNKFGIKKLIIFLLIISQVVFLSACGIEQEKVSYGEDWLLNTFCYIKAFDSGKEEVIKDAFALAREYENKLSRTIPSSQISTGNYDDETMALIDQALKFENETEGQFCIHLGAVSALWDFSGSNGGPFVPSEEEIASALAEQKVDLGAIAKGYIADRVAEYLSDNGVSSAIVSLGGNIVCVGEKLDGTSWQVGIEKPFSKGEKLEERESLGLVSVKPNYSVVTSGVYERCFKDEDGRFYHHILDSASGYPAETDLVAATIIGPSSCVCDALATIAVLKWKAGAPEFLAKYPEYSYVLVGGDGEIIDPEALLK